MCGGETTRNPRPWADNGLRRRLVTHDDLISRNSLWNQQLPQCEKSELHDHYVMPASGFMWSQASVAGLWSLCSRHTYLKLAGSVRSRNRA